MKKNIVLIAGVIAMAVVVTTSNFLVQFAINDWLTWAAFTYPIAFLVTDTVNRLRGANAARKVVLVGFAFAVLLSIFVDPRIAFASGSAFFVAQMLDVTIFDRLRKSQWWKAPAISSLAGSAIDTALFFSIAFIGTGVPWVTLALGDFGIKIFMALVLLLPFRFLTQNSDRQEA